MLTQKEKEFFPCDCNSHECPWELIVRKRIILTISISAVTVIMVTRKKRESPNAYTKGKELSQ
jgi:hypothetical protein